LDTPSLMRWYKRRVSGGDSARSITQFRVAGAGFFLGGVLPPSRAAVSVVATLLTESAVEGVLAVVVSRVREVSIGAPALGAPDGAPDGAAGVGTLAAGCPLRQAPTTVATTAASTSAAR
jgi:hypothetical protein